MSSKAPSVIFPTQSTVTCKGCDSEFDVKWFCKNCTASLCDKCKQEHKDNKFLTDHKVVSRTADLIRIIESSKVIESCPIHTDCDITVFCNDCDTPCCISCIEEKHQRHAIFGIAKKYMECEDKVNDLAIKLEKQTLQDLRSNIEELRQALTSHERSYEEVEKEVNKFRQELKAAVDESCESILSELKQNETNQSDDIKKTIADLENKVKDTERFISLCGDKIRKGGIELVEFSTLTPPSHVHSTPIHSQRIPVFVKGEGLINIIMQKVGELKLLAQQDCKSDTSVDGSRVIAQMGRSNKPEPDIEVKVIAKFDAEILGGAVVPTGKDKEWIAYWWSDTMYLYDSKGNVIRSVVVEKMKSIWDLVLRRSGDALVSTNDNKVRLVTTKAKTMTLIDCGSFSPKGVCLTENEEIVVCMASQGDKNHVAVYSPDGKRKIKEIFVKDRQGNQMLTNPTRLVMLGKDLSVINHQSNVVTFTQDGALQWVYTGSGIGQTKFAPVGLCIDEFFNILISDIDNHCIHYVDDLGSLIQILLTKGQHGIEKPFGIGVDNDTGLVWIGMICKKLAVVKYLK